MVTEQRLIYCWLSNVGKMNKFDHLSSLTGKQNCWIDYLNTYFHSLMDSARYIIIETSLFHQDQSMHNNMHLNKCLNWWDHFIFDSWFGFQIGFKRAALTWIGWVGGCELSYGEEEKIMRFIIFPLQLPCPCYCYNQWEWWTLFMQHNGPSYY